MTDTEILEARLTQAEDALHALVLGQQSVSIEYEGHKTTFQATSQAKLQAYIYQLKVQLGKVPKRRAQRVTF